MKLEPVDRNVMEPSPLDPCKEKFVYGSARPLLRIGYDVDGNGKAQVYRCTKEGTAVSALLDIDAEHASRSGT